MTRRRGRGRLLFISDPDQASDYQCAIQWLDEEEEEWGRFSPSWWTKQNISTPLLSRGTRKYVQTENLRISALKLNEKRNEQINGIRKLVVTQQKQQYLDAEAEEEQQMRGRRRRSETTRLDMKYTKIVQKVFFEYLVQSSSRIYSIQSVCNKGFTGGGSFRQEDIYY